MNLKPTTPESFDGATVTVYNTDSYNGRLIPDKAPFQATVLRVEVDERLVKSLVTGEKYWLYHESFHPTTAEEIKTEEK